MPARRYGDWVSAYLQYVDNSESPLSYHVWAGISTVSSVLQRRVYMHWGHTTIYPNQYILLIGPSGVRKGEPITITRSLLASIGITVIPEYSTFEGLIQRIKKSPITYKLGNELKSACAVSCVSEEFGVFLGENRTQLLAAITNWYDNPPDWTYETKHGGKDTIVSPCVNVLGAMAPDWIPLCIPQAAIGGGTTSRFIFIVEKFKRKTVSNPNAFQIDTKARDELIHDLECIAALQGAFSFSDDALRLYMEWYEEEDRLAREGILVIQDPKFSGYVSRRATHVKKVAMALSASRGDDLIIHSEDFKRALGLLKQAEVSMPETFALSGSSINATSMSTVMEFMRNRGETSLSEILNVFYRDVDVRTMDTIERTLDAMKCIRVTRNTETGDINYKWIAKKTTRREDAGESMIVVKDGKVVS